MVDKWIDEMINRFLDGDASPEEIAEIHDAIENNAEVRAYYNKMSNLSELLHRADDIDPPSELKQNIMASVSQIKKKTNPRPNYLEALGNFLRGKLDNKVIGAFGFGVAVTLIIVSLYTGKPGERLSIDNKDLTGTIILDEFADRFNLVKYKDISIPGISGFIKTKIGKHLDLIELDMNSRKSANIIFNYAIEDVGLMAFRQDNTAGEKVQINQNSVAIQITGKNKYRLYFERKSDKSPVINLTIWSGSSIFEYEITFDSTIRRE